MAVLAYVLLPVTGLTAFLWGRSKRARFHGLQAIALGLAWAVFLYVAASISPRVTQAVWGVGAATWLTLLIGTALGRDLRLPLVGRLLWDSLAED